MSFENICDITGAIIFTYQFSSIEELRIYITCHCTRSYSLECEGNINKSPYFTASQGRVHFPGRGPLVRVFGIYRHSVIVHLYRDLQDLSSWGRKEHNEIRALDRS